MDDDLLRERHGAPRHGVDRQLAWSLAFVAGAINAGGFLAVQTYTSHVTGPISRAADELALGRVTPALAALGMVACFLAGAFASGVLVHAGRALRLRSRYALALAIEALLLLVFGAFGASLQQHRELVLPATVVLLCFLMGMHNAIVTHISSAVVRTTHMTGIVTDIGIGLANLAFRPRNAHEVDDAARRRARLKLHALILASFFVGGIAGALGFKHVGYAMTFVLAFFLVLLAVRPIWLDIRLRSRHARRRRASAANGPRRAA
ncbi:MAG: DUF1275 domain-containing protein [Planctomycetota bacterium]|nr:MAG: DUF1275 domain-containing protein [Planctomycetota bacterium]